MGKKAKALKVYIRELTEERDMYEQQYHDLASVYVYEGNSVYYWHSKAMVYSKVIQDAWDVLRDAGIPPDGTFTLVDGIKRLLTQGNR